MCVYVVTNQHMVDGSVISQLSTNKLDEIDLGADVTRNMRPVLPSALWLPNYTVQSKRYRVKNEGVI